MADRAISAMAALTGANLDRANDLIPVVDVSVAASSQNKYMVPNELSAGLFSGAMAKKSTDQTGANYSGAGSTIAWNAEVYDTDGYHDTVTNNTRLTIPSGVNYVQVGGNVRIQNGTSESCGLSISKNGSTSFDGACQHNQTSGSASYNVSICSGPIPVVATDYFEITFFTAADTSIDIIAARSNFWIRMLG